MIKFLITMICLVFGSLLSYFIVIILGDPFLSYITGICVCFVAKKLADLEEE